MKILDGCCGGKMFWYEKDLDFVDFQDNRELQVNCGDTYHSKEEAINVGRKELMNAKPHNPAS